MELVIAIGIVAIVASALVTAVTSSLRYSQAIRTRSQGVKLAQEGVELARTLRDTSTWDVFETYAATGSWCLNAAGVWSPDTSSGNCPTAAGSDFWRRVLFTWNTVSTPNRMEVIVTVSWGERNNASTVNLQTYFTEWK